jgi:ABC-type glycerol-3-phosphate transport system substrate-binding protein
LLESAALKGLLYPYDSLSNAMDDPGWFDYARQLSQVMSSTYGIPFGGDLMVLAYDPLLIQTLPKDMATAISLGNVMLFPAADPQAFFTFCMYLAVGQDLQDAQGRPYISESTLSDILQTYQQASLAGVMPSWLTQYSNDEQVWEAFNGQQFPMAVLWTSTYLPHQLDPQADLALAPLPTIAGSPITLATGWSWALAGPDSRDRSLSVQLAEFMVEKDFLADWNAMAGYVPPRDDALQNWQGADQSKLLEQISHSASLVPPTDIVSSMGPIIEQAVVGVLNAQIDPTIAARSVAAQVNQP